MSQSTPTKHDGRAVLFAVAELLVNSNSILEIPIHIFVPNLFVFIPIPNKVFNQFLVHTHFPYTTSYIHSARRRSL